MCGRYYFSIEELSSQHPLTQKLSQISLSYAQKEIFPSNRALVLVEDGIDYKFDVMTWGVPSYQGTLLINARNESVEEKKTFRPMLPNRCLIPCQGFYEWKEKKKVLIYKKHVPVLYLAGIFNEQKQFVLLTGKSEKEMKHVHHRTPILVDEKDINRYLHHELTFVVDNDELGFRLEEPYEVSS